MHAPRHVRRPAGAGRGAASGGRAGGPHRPQSECGHGQRSDPRVDFTVERRTTRSATFASVLALDPAAAGAVKKRDLQYRMTVELDGGAARRASGRRARADRAAGGAARNRDPRVSRRDRSVRQQPEHADGRQRAAARGVSARRRAERAQSGDVRADRSAEGAGRRGADLHPAEPGAVQQNEGYDICATDACQVYFGAGTEDPLATQAVMETRGVVATYDGKPINALYSSTCGGRTEDAENIFNEKVPYLVSTSCEYKHPAPLPFDVVALHRELEGRRARRRAACRISPRPRASWACRRAANRRPTEPAGARDVHPPDVLSVGGDDVGLVLRDRAGNPARRRTGARRGSAVPAHRQEERVRMAAGRPGLAGTGDGCACW